MDKSKIFISFQEPKSILEIVNAIPDGNDFVSKLKIYMTSRANQFITMHNKYLEFKKTNNQVGGGGDDKYIIKVEICYIYKE